MKRIICLTMMVTLLTVGFVFASAIELPRTGQTICYDTSGNVISCTGTGQDGEIQAGVAWPEPRFTDNGDDTMTDNLTGLMWKKDANLPGGTTDWQSDLDYANSLTLAGYSDWRLPNVNELESLYNANEANSATWLNAQGITNVQADGYHWSSTTVASSPDLAWIVHMWSGGVHYDPKSVYHFVWPVRGGQCGSLDHSVICLPKTGQTKCYNTSGSVISCTGTGQDGEIQAGVARPDPGFTDHGDGTITDNLTGLMWTKNANLPPGGTTNWQQALGYANNLTLAGYSDWRLPNRKELHSLQDFSRYSPALPASHPFTNVQGPYYWSSTNVAKYTDYAWVVSMWDGYVGNGYKSYYYCVWPVRSGSFGPTVINLSSFTAIPKAGRVVIEWVTESEIDNAGFNLYRAESENGEYVKVNESLIPTEGSVTQGETYQYIDENVKNRRTYYYKLEDIDLNGTSTMHGPVSAEPRRLGRD